MAKPATTKPAAEAKGKPAEAKPAMKYGIADLEAATGLLAASVRVGLRESSFKKVDGRWGWNTKAELDEVLKYFKERAARTPNMTKADAKPVKKAQPSAPGTKSTKKAAAAA